MDLANVEWADGELISELTRSRSAGESRSLQGLIKVGRPVVVDAIKYHRAAKQTDAMMEMLVADSDFYYVRLPLSFRPVEHVELTLVNVAFTLGTGGQGAEAWSMEPQKVTDEIKVGTEAKIDGGLKFTPAELSSSIGSSEEYVVYQPVLEAFNLGRDDPAWEFRPSKGRALSGSQVLHMVIRQPKKSVSQCRVTINGDAEDARGPFSFLWRWLRKTEAEPLSFCCPDGQ